MTTLLVLYMAYSMGLVTDVTLVILVGIQLLSMLSAGLVVREHDFSAERFAIVLVSILITVGMALAIIYV